MEPSSSSSSSTGIQGDLPCAKRRRADPPAEAAPAEWSRLPEERLHVCIGRRDAGAVTSLIGGASRCPALLGYDLRWRVHAGQKPEEAAWHVKLRRPLLSNKNDAAVARWPGLGLEFTETQRKSLRWMLTKEAGSDDELVVERGCHESLFSTHRGVDFQLRLSFGLRGGILADAMGYGKTLLAVALTAVSCAEPLACRESKQPCGATLVFMPENLVCQWLQEFKKLLGDTIRVRFFGADSLGVTCASGLQEATLGSRADEDAGNNSSPAQVYAVASIEGWMEMMQAPWPDALALLIPYSLLYLVEPWFCLHRYHWRRIVVDELHEALACKVTSDALALISAQHVWGLSGTLPTSTAADVARVAALFGIAMPADATNAGRFLDCYVRRNDASVTEDIRVKEHCVVVRPTPMERAIYLACQHDFDITSADPEAYAGYVPPFLSTWRGLQEHGREAALVKLCCHHQVTATDVELLSTPAQSVERLHTWKRHHCMEAKRLVGHRALLAEWMGRNCRAAGDPHLQPTVLLPEAPRASATDQEAWDCLQSAVAQVGAMDDGSLLAACEADLAVTPFAVCERPDEAEARWLEWCHATGLAPGTRGAISRLRKIMYDEFWGRLVDGQEGWKALSLMPGRDWRKDYAAAERSRLLQAAADYASSLQSIRFLEAAVSQAASPQLDCVICLQRIREPRLTPCAHVFCAPCIERSVSMKPECPQCRAPVVSHVQLSVLNQSCVEICSATGSKSVEADSLGPQRGPGKSGEDSSSSGGEFGSKISALVSRLRAIHRLGEKAVVFAQWQDLIFKIRAALSALQIPAEVLAGAALDRASVLQRFASPGLSVLLLSLEDSASGTNMAHANHVLLVHPMVAATVEEQRAYEAQAVGRVCRWGQTRTVQVWRFVMESTIEADLAAQRVASEEELDGQGAAPINTSSSEEGP